MKDMIDKLLGMKTTVDELAKWQRSGSTTMVNREAHYQALAAVKDHVLKYVTAIVSDMQNDEMKSVGVGGGELNIRKIMADMYSGTVRRGVDVIHEFDRITIPQLAGQLQSLLELYDPDSLKEDSSPKELLVSKLKPLADEHKGGLVSQLLSMLDGQDPKTPAQAAVVEKDWNTEVAEIIAEANFITDEAKRRMQQVDPRAELQDLKERVEAMLARVSSVVSALSPTSQDKDTLHDTLHQMQQKHDLLADRAEQELNILSDKVKQVTEKLDNYKPSGRTITIKVD